MRPRSLSAAIVMSAAVAATIAADASAPPAEASASSGRTPWFAAVVQPASDVRATTRTRPSCVPAWTSSAKLASWSTRGYLVNNNSWSGDAGAQTVSACAWNRWSVTSNQPGAGADDAVKTYPDTQRHVSYPLSSLASLPSRFAVTTPGGGGHVPTHGKQWNATYDLWLDNFGTEVMIWNNWTMNWQYWWGVNGGVRATIDGVAYHAYRNNAGTGLWFVRDTVTNQGTVDLAHVLRWAVAKGWLRSSQVLGEIEYGFEVAYTGEPTTFTLDDYSLSLP